MKKRKELREAVAESANRIKSNIYLGMLLEVSEIFRKALCEECTELTELQWEQRKAIRDIISMESLEAEDIGFVNAVIDASRQANRRRA